MEKKVKILPPTMPNFYFYEQSVSLKQDGFNTKQSFDIKDFTAEEAKQYAQLMYDTFLEHWETRKNKPND